MLHSSMFPPRLLALCTSAALVLSAGCSPDSPTVAGPEPHFDQETRGATQISGIGAYDLTGECDDPEGDGSSYNLTMTGDLEGCHYVFIETASCTAGGAYTERGTETFVGSYNGAAGTFRTTYLFTATYRDCANFVGEIAGRCQHPLIAGSGRVFSRMSPGGSTCRTTLKRENFPIEDISSCKEPGGRAAGARPSIFPLGET